MHLVIWDGSSAYVDSKIVHAGEEIIAKYDNMKLAVFHAESYNAENRD